MNEHKVSKINANGNTENLTRKNRTNEMKVFRAKVTEKIK